MAIWQTLIIERLRDLLVKVVYNLIALNKRKLNHEDVE